MDLDVSTLTPLFEFAQQLLSEANSDDNNLYSLRQECALAKASLHNTITIIDSIGRSISQPAKALALSQTVREALLEVAKITKMAVEVESLKTSRLDIIQLLHILRQIPALVQSLIEEHYISLLLQLRTDIIRKYGSCPFEYLSETALLAHLAEFTEKLNSRITTLKLIHPQGCLDMQPQMAIPYDQVKEMLGSVP